MDRCKAVRRVWREMLQRHFEAARQENQADRERLFDLLRAFETEFTYEIHHMDEGG